MKVIIGCLFSAVLASLYANLFAQSPHSVISGKVVIENHQPAESSTIVLLKSSDSSIVKSALVGKSGNFEFTSLSGDSYLLLITKIGFRKLYKGPYKISSGQTLALGEIIIIQDTKQLNEVRVTGNRPAIELLPGKTILNVQNSAIDAGSTAYDILKGSAGVRVDNSNNISIVGKQSALITIDGKPTSLTGDDLVSVLRSMQSNTIDRIELITSGSAKYDAASGGIINIISRQGKNLGANAIVTGSLGYGSYLKGSGGIVFNDRTKKFNVFGYYNHSYNKTFHNFTSDRIVNYNNVISDFTSVYSGLQKTNNDNYNFGTDYFLSTNHSIGFLISGYTRDDIFAKSTTLNIANQGIRDSTILTTSNLARQYSSINYNLNYNGKLDNAGTKLSADLNYTDYNRSSNEYIANSFFNAAGNSYRPQQLLQNLSPSNIRIWLSKIDFVAPLSKTAKLEAGLKYGNVTSNNTLVFGPQVNGVYTSNPNFSSNFIYKENVNAAYVNYENTYGKFDLIAGLRAEQTIAHGNTGNISSNYTDLFPHASLNYKQDDKNSYSISFSRGITRPAYEDINPFLYYVDVYNYRSGNPNLKPEYSNIAELTYSHDETFVAKLYGSIVADAYEFLFYQQNDTTKVNVTTHKNLGRVYTSGINVYKSIDITNWWNSTFSLDVAYQRYVAYPVNGNLNKGTQDVVFSTKQAFIIGKTTSAEFRVKYESPTFYGVNQFKSYYNADLGIRQQLFNKRGSLNLSVNDIFNNIRDRSVTNYQNLNLTIVDKKESQVARLTFTYRFGRSSSKDSSIHKTGAEEEQKRVSGN